MENTDQATFTDVLGNILKTFELTKKPTQRLSSE